MEPDLDISQVVQPPPGHCLESLRSVAYLREVLWTHGPVAGGGEDSGPVGRGPGGREPENSHSLSLSLLLAWLATNVRLKIQYKW